MKSNKASTTAIAVVVPVVVVIVAVVVVLYLRKKQNAAKRLGTSEIVQKTVQLQTPRLEGDVVKPKLKGSVKPLAKHTNVRRVRVKQLKPLAKAGAK